MVSGQGRLGCSLSAQLRDSPEAGSRDPAPPPQLQTAGSWRDSLNVAPRLAARRRCPGATQRAVFAVLDLQIQTPPCCPGERQPPRSDIQVQSAFLEGSSGVAAAHCLIYRSSLSCHPASPQDPKNVFRCGVLQCEGECGGVNAQTCCCRSL